MERNKLHLLHIRDAIEKIESYSKDTDYETFAKSGVEYDAIMMQMVVIGEAVNSLSEDFIEKYHNLPWGKAVGMRNRIAHGYFDINPKIVWETAKEDLPVLRKDIERLL